MRAGVQTAVRRRILRRGNGRREIQMAAPTIIAEARPIVPNAVLDVGAAVRHG